MKTIALFVQHPTCSVQSSNGVLNALGNRFNYKVFSKHEVEEFFFDDVDLICIPGGVGDADKFDTYFGPNRSYITKYVQSGGAYLGICMGGYWAASDYFGFLYSDTTVSQYIRRPNSDTRRPHAKHIDVQWNNQWERMFFYDGFAVSGDEKNFKTIARYMNDDPMAIIQNNIGIIGCHLESQEYWYDNYSWMKGKYHGGKHHVLLNEFIDELI